MEPKAYIAIFGSLFVIMAMIVFGIWFTGAFAKVVLVFGVTLAIVWFVGIVQISMAMNSDI